MLRFLKSNKYILSSSFLLFIIFCQLSVYTLSHHPLSGDEIAIWFQSQIFSSFKIWVDAPPFPFFFNNHYIVADQNGWYGQYPPIFPLMIAPGNWFFSNINLMACLYSVLSILLFYKLLIKIKFPKTYTLLIAALIFSSPSYVFYQISLYSHIGQLFLYFLTLYLFLNFINTSKTFLIPICSVLIISQIINRPITGIGCNLPLILTALIHSYRQRNMIPFLALSLIPAIAIGLLYLEYDYRNNGQFFLPSYLEAGGNINHFKEISLRSFFFSIHQIITGSISNIWGVSSLIKNPLFINLFSYLSYLLSFVIGFRIYHTTKSQDQKTFLLITLSSLILTTAGYGFFQGNVGGRYGERYLYEIIWIVPLICIYFLYQFRKTFSYFIIISLITQLTLIPIKSSEIREQALHRNDLFFQSQKLGEKSLTFIQSSPTHDPFLYTRNSPVNRDHLLAVCPEYLMGNMPLDRSPREYRKDIASALGLDHYYIYRYELGRGSFEMEMVK